VAARVPNSRELLKTGIAHHQAGRLDEAEAIYQEVLKQNPDEADALSLMGVLCRQRKRLPEAEGFLRRAVQLRADWAPFHNNLGNVLADAGKKSEAVEAYRQAVRLNANDPVAHNNLGNGLKDLEQYVEAEKELRTAISLRKDWGEAYNNLAVVLKNMRRVDEAEQVALTAARLCPNLAEVFNTLGTIFKDQNRWPQAEAALRRAIELSPKYAEALVNLGNVLERTGREDEAIVGFKSAAEFKPDYADAFNSLGNATSNRGLHDEAIAAYRQALELKPEHSEVLSNLASVMSAHPAFSAAQVASQYAKWASIHADPLRKFQVAYSNNRDPNRLLRIGYVSPDFSNHPVGRFLRPIFDHHDHEHFEIICYSDGRTPDSYTEALKARADEWHAAADLMDGDLAERMRAHGIDILVDLAVHTLNNRLLMFARKPAPVQITYLGYPGTTGLAAMDYRITDRFLSLEGSASEGPEKLIYLKSYWCYQAPTIAPEVAPLPATQTGHVTFGCLNNPSKVSRQCLELWAEILRGVPDSHLILFSKKGQSEDRLYKLFAAHDIGRDRIELVFTQPFDQYLATYNRIDIALDPFPVNGGTTSCDALWMGCPLVTLAGDLAVRRSGSSILGQIGLSEFVAASPDEYAKIATELARDTSKLAQLRSTMRGRMLSSPLMDAAGFARELEQAYRAVWRAAVIT